MPNLTLAPRSHSDDGRNGAAGKATRRRRRRSGGWLTAMKVVFLLGRWRHRRRRQRSSPSLRQIALVVVSAGLAILVIRVASQGGPGAGPPARRPATRTHDAAREAPATDRRRATTPFPPPRAR